MSAPTAPATKPEVNTGFDMIPRILRDSGMAGALGPATMQTYETLLRFEFREKSKETISIRLTQRKLAALVGFSGRQGVVPHLRKLEALGWIKPTRYGRDCTEYEVGTVYADGTRELYAVEFARGFLALLDGNAKKIGNPSFRALDPFEIVEEARHYVAYRIEKSASAATPPAPGKAITITPEATASAAEVTSAALEAI